jgi:hypothetical protein
MSRNVLKDTQSILYRHFTKEIILQEDRLQKTEHNILHSLQYLVRETPSTEASPLGFYWQRTAVGGK